MRWRSPYGTLVATRVAGLAQWRSRLEVRAMVALPGNEVAAQVQAQRLALDIDAAIRRIVGLPVDAGPVREFARQLRTYTPY